MGRGRGSAAIAQATWVAPNYWLVFSYDIVLLAASAPGTPGARPLRGVKPGPPGSKVGTGVPARLAPRQGPGVE